MAICVKIFTDKDNILDILTLIFYLIVYTDKPKHFFIFILEQSSSFVFSFSDRLISHTRPIWPRSDLAGRPREGIEQRERGEQQRNAMCTLHRIWRKLTGQVFIIIADPPSAPDPMLPASWWYLVKSGHTGHWLLADISISHDRLISNWMFSLFVS